MTENKILNMILDVLDFGVIQLPTHHGTYHIDEKRLLENIRKDKRWQTIIALQDSETSKENKN